MMTRFQDLARPLLLSLLVGCGTWVGNAVDQSGETGKDSGSTSSMRVEIQTKSTDGTLNARHVGKDGALAGTVQLTEAILLVERVRFTKEGKEVAVSNWLEARPIHLGSSAVQIGSDLAVAPDSFDAVWLETVNGLGALTLKGAFVDATTTAPLDLNFSEKLAINVAISAEPVPAGTSQATLTLTLDLDFWFDFREQPVDFRDLAPPITMDAHADLQKILRNNIGRSGSGSETPRETPTDGAAPSSPSEKDDDDDDDD